ncbi:MAG: type II toxin-antitoxin system VapC family toxin [Euryarchaeota archaeon]|nr:type II toxin-antitoxin system VapC family toxin [Euryarchaeota archaeon]
MGKEICIDSDVIISLLRGDKETKERLEEIEYDFSTTTINAFEILFGRKSDEVYDLLGCFSRIYDFDYESAKVASDIMRDLKKRGKLLDMRDVFVASICITRKLPLLTYNTKHFIRLKDYGLELFQIY